MADFFVSYTKADEPWAEWLSWILEEAGFSVTVQVWDFGAGGNFVLEMQRAASEASRTIAVLSPDYLNSRFAAPEWASAFSADPDGLKRRLIPVRVRECRLDGLWTAIGRIDLVGLDEQTAQRRLLNAISGERAKPSQKPRFPGVGDIGTNRPPFPGVAQASQSAHAAPYMPRFRASYSDLDKRRFLREGFSTVASFFEGALGTLVAQHKTIEYDLNRDNATQFTAELFVNGKSKARCKIWISNQLGDGIAYFDGNFFGGGNTLNEMLVVSESSDGLMLSAQMGSFTFGEVGKGLDLKQLSSQDGAEYLWRRLVSHLE